MLWELLPPQYTAYQKHLCHRYDAPANPPQIQDFSLWTCFAKTISTAFHTCRLYGKNKIVIVLAVEVRHQALLA